MTQVSLAKLYFISSDLSRRDVRNCLHFVVPTLPHHDLFVSVKRVANFEMLELSELSDGKEEERLLLRYLIVEAN